MIVSPPMERFPSRTARILLVLLLALGTVSDSVRAEPELPEEPWRMSTVEVDGAGEADPLLRRAQEAIAAERWGDAVESLLELRALHGDALVSVPEPWAWQVPLYWPARQVVELLMGRLPEAVQTQLLDAWEGQVGALVEQARGDSTALERLADEWAATEEGRRALRFVAARDLEAGRFAAVARRLEHWLRLPGTSLDERAVALVQLADVLSALGDEAGLAELNERFDVAVMSRGVLTARGRTTPRQRVRKRLQNLALDRRQAARRVRRPAASKDPRELEVLWTREHEHPGLLAGTDELEDTVRIFAGAAADGEDLVLHEGAVVRRIESFTGRELWRFPPPDGGRWNYDPRHRYAPGDLPMRTVDVAGDLVLVVLGDPAAQGFFEFRGGQVRLDDQARASRTRLVALDRRTGQLRWATGGPRNAHPILGDPHTGCQSPPLVVGDAVYALFARRRGAIEAYLARLDLQTGTPEWVTYLGSGKSGRSVDADEGDERFGGKRAEAPSWGARPSLAGDEICALPHAGFAAGVRTGDGALRWLRALPRYAGILPLEPVVGFSSRNAPLAHGASWILAPLDAPYLVGLDRGTGRWRWSLLAESSDGNEPWHHALSVSDVSGTPQLKLLYTESGLLDLTQPKAGARVGSYLDGYTPVGRPLDLGDHFVVAGAWSVGSALTDATASEATVPALLSVPWDPERQEKRGAIRRWALDDLDFPRMGDVLPVGDVWVVVGKDRTGAVAPPRVTRRWARARLLDDAAGATARAAASALTARLDADAEAAGEALGAAAATGDEAALDVALGAVQSVVAKGVRGTERLGSVILEHAPRRGAGILADLVTHDASRRRPAALVDLLDRWVALADGGLVKTMPGVSVRTDLFAGLLFEILAGDPAMRPALTARERRHGARIDEALELDEATLREAIRRAVGTPAASRGREALAERLAKRGLFVAAARLWADLRLDGSVSETGRTARSRLAGLQRREATLLARGGHLGRARRLLADLRRWAPAVRDAATRREQDALETLLAMEAGWRPTGAPPVRFDVWRGVEESPAAGALRGIVFPELVGPGAASRRDELLLFRGLGAEVWSRSRRQRIAAFEDAGAGWFGGALQEAPPWLEGGGVIVTSLVAGEPADRAGLRAGDWVLAWDGQRVRGASAFMHTAAAARPGVPVSLDVRRRGRKVLDRLVPGSRPVKDGVVVQRDALWIDARGRVLVPGRIGLTWIDLEKAEQEPFWTWSGAGVVRRVDVFGDTAVVLVRRVLQNDTLVGLDLATGAERWRRDVEGNVAVLEATGSALFVTASDPARAVVLDPTDGSARVQVDLQDRTAEQRAFTLFPSPSAATVHGRLWCVTGDSVRGRQLRILNTTTGEVASEELVDHDFEPLIAGDGVVAVAVGRQTLRLLAPDPLTGRPAWRVAMPGSGQRPIPVTALDGDSRLFVRGDRLYVLRNTYRRHVHVEAFEIDFESLGPKERPGDVAAFRALRYIVRRPLNEGIGVDGYVTDGRATLEGFLLSAASTGDRQHRVTCWVGRGGQHQAWPDPTSASAGGVRQIRRHPASRSANLLFVPTDEGALLVPLMPGSR